VGGGDGGLFVSMLRVYFDVWLFIGCGCYLVGCGGYGVVVVEDV